jgi:hypothetical protein
VTPTATLLRYLADVAAAPPSDRHPLLPPGAGPEMLDVTRSGQAPDWLGTRLSMPLEAPYPTAEVHEHRVRSTPALRNLAAMAALQPAEQVLRLGWVAVAGTVAVEGREVTCCLPLISQPIVVLGQASSRCRIAATGPTELTPLVEDPDAAARLEAAAQYGGGAFDGSDQEPSPALLRRLPHLQAWIHDVAAEAGLPPLRAVLPPAEDPLDHRRGEGLVACVGALVYVDRDLFRPNLETTLRRWAATPEVEATAFGALYAGVPPAPVPTGEAVVGPLRLTEAQREAVVRARRERLAVISGPPGSGKSHTVAAVAADAVAAGRSVLVATRSGHAADVVSGLLGRQPGPDPLRFGDGADEDLVRQATSRGTSGGDAARAQAELARACARQRLVTGAIARLLDDERRAEGAGRWDGFVAHLASLAPGAFDPGVDLGTLAALAAEAERRRARVAERDTWWRRRQARRAERRLTAALGASAPLPAEEVATVVECAIDRRTAARLATTGGTVAGPAWDQLEAADADVRAAAGRLAEVLGASEERRRRARGVAGDVGVALRVGRRQRRRLLRNLDGHRLVAGLPLWVGTLRDIDDLLPETPALFDLVILDEASQIDQPASAGALLRARRAVIVGDPRQLRHVSFVSDATMAAALAQHGLGTAAGRLDVRRASVLDAAAGVTTTTWLDEHFRSVPHLIDFSTRRFYGGRLHVATRRPANEVADAIEVVRPDAAGDADAADATDLATALRLVAGLAESGRRDIAVVTPFRDVADAAQDALLAAYDVDAIRRLLLRVGTVHAFQGAEADHVVLILGVRHGDAAGRRRFVEDPHLFNVMVTRARRSLTVVTTLAPPAGAPRGLIEEYLVHAGRPPGPPADGPCPTPWAEALARELRAIGAVVRTGYPVGRFTLDVVLGAGEGAVAVDAAVDRAGIDAHIARRRLLAGQGWRTLDGYPTRWDGDPARAAIELAGALTPADAPAGRGG